MSADNIKLRKKESLTGGQRMLLSVLVMGGVALVVGAAALVGFIASKGSGSANTCEPTFYSLAAGENAQVVQVDGDKVTLAIITGTASKTLRTIDMCSGEVMRELQLKPAILQDPF